MLQAIKHYMTKNPRVVSGVESVHRARQIMQAAGIRHLPVMEGERAIGIVTERDIRLLETCGRGGTDIAVSEAMTPDPYLVDAEESLDVVAHTMATRKLGSALVTGDGHVVGIFSAVDALHALADLFAEYYAAPTSDQYGNIIPRGAGHTGH